jgi:hypothetical protein
MKQSEDHMDDLFRKAGENYPLKTDGADWDKVMARLQNGPETAPVLAREGEDKRASRKLLWLLLLLLLPVGWLLSRYERGSFTKPSSGQTAQKAGQMAQQAGQTARQAPVAPNAGTQAAPSSETTPSSGATTPSGSAPSSPSVTSLGGTAPSGSAQPSTAGEPAATAHTSHAPAATAPPATIFPATQGVTTIRKGNALNAAPSGLTPDEPSGTTNTTSAAAAANAAAANKTSAAAAANAASKTGAPASSKDSSATASTSATASASVPLKDTTRAKPTPAKSSKHTATAKAQRGFYAGVVGGPDVTTIKWQEIQSPGFSVGLTLGYRFNRHLAVEADALWDHKNYYTAGQYFNKAKTDIPANLTLTSMNGNCSMIELPVDLRWDFVQFRHGGGLFATAGFSSYLMKKEAYSYEGNWGATYPSMDGTKSYLNSGNDFFSMLQVSAGYTFKLDHVGDVRIEPYWKIPLRGVGIGSLPMTSTGIYIGITRPFR